MIINLVPKYGSFALCVVLALAACSGSNSVPAESGATTHRGPATSHDDDERILNIYNWSNYIDNSVISQFEQEFHIKVNYDIYDSNEVLESKLLAGHSGYDVVVPSGYFLQHQIAAGVYRILDKSQLPNLQDPNTPAARYLAAYDPGQRYAVVYTWLNTTGLGYSVTAMRARLPNTPVDSWRIVFDPHILARFQDCGIAVIDEPLDVVISAFIFLGKDPNTESLQDLKEAERLLLSIRRFIRYVDTTRYIEFLATGEVCLAIGWSGDVLQARDRAREAATGVDIAFSIPKEGSLNDGDMLAIPASAPHPRNAHLFINFMLRPEVAARISNAIKYANGVESSAPFLDVGVRNDPVIYPPPEMRAKLVPVRARSQQFTRALERTWIRFKTGT